MIFIFKCSFVLFFLGHNQQNIDSDIRESPKKYTKTCNFDYSAESWNSKKMLEGDNLYNV